jgi:hypothetical protein
MLIIIISDLHLTDGSCGPTPSNCTAEDLQEPGVLQYIETKDTPPIIYT